MESKYENKFFSKGFFKSQNGESYTGITLLGTSQKNVPELGFFYVNSGLDFSPYQIFRKNNIKELLSYINDPKGTFLFENLSLYISEGKGDINIVNKGTKYDFSLDSDEIFLLKTYLIYVNNYIEKKDDIENISKEITKLDSFVKHYLKEQGKTSISEYNKIIYKDNIIKDSYGEYKKICIPSIEHELHGQKKGIKTGYYFKLFPEYIDNIRNVDDDKIKYNGERYPLQLVVQEDGSSTMLTFSELELYKLLSFLNSIKNNKKLEDTDTISVNNESYLEMSNSYNGKVYINKDVLENEDFNKLSNHIKNKDSSGIKEFVISLQKAGKLQNNKFINNDTLKTLKLKQRVFNNFSLSHGKDGINDDSWIFQIGSIKGSNEATLNVIKGDLNTSKGKQFLSVSVSDKDILTLTYKIEKFLDLLNSPYLLSLQKLYKNIETIRFLGIKDKNLISSEIINSVLRDQKDSKFLFNDKISLKKSELEFNIFKPNIVKQLNTSIFTIKDSLKDISEDRYPINMKISLEGNKIAYFNLGLSNLISLYKNLNKGSDFILDAKNGVYKRLLVREKEEIVYFAYYESNSLSGLENNKPKFWDLIDKNIICDRLTAMYNIVNGSYKELLIKSILYSFNKIKYD